MTAAAASEAPPPQPPSERVRLRRKRERGSYERDGDRRDPRRGADRAPGHRRRARPAVRDPDAARAQRRRRLLPRLDRQPHAARAGGGRAGVPDGVADRRAGAGALGDAPLGQLPLGDAARAGARVVEDPQREARGAARRSSSTSCPGRWADVRAPTRERAEGDVGAGAGDRRGLGEGPQRRRRWTTRRTTRCRPGRA